MRASVAQGEKDWEGKIARKVLAAGSGQSLHGGFLHGKQWYGDRRKEMFDLRPQLPIIFRC
jgi:hypothetical protein